MSKKFKCPSCSREYNTDDISDRINIKEIDKEDEIILQCIKCNNYFTFYYKTHIDVKIKTQRISKREAEDLFW